MEAIAEAADGRPAEDAAARPLAWPIAEIEQQLSAAVSASLRFPHEERILAIALMLLGDDPMKREPAPPLLTEKPAELDEELAEISLLLKDAVNSAARRNDEPAPPQVSIALYLLAQANPIEETQHYTDEDLQLERGNEPAPAPPPASSASTESSAPPALTRGASGATAVALALTRRGAMPQNKTGVHALVRRPSGASKMTAENAKAQLRKALAKSQNKRVPVLGATAETVLPAVIGAFQEHAAQGAAKQIDEKIIAQALAAKVVPFDADGPADPPSS